MIQNEYAADLITLVDEEGKEHEFEIIDVLDNDKGCFYALAPMENASKDISEADGVYYIFEEIEENGEKQLAEIEDDDLLNELSEIFEQRFEDMYEKNKNMD